jgi:hypothetical protein
MKPYTRLAAARPAPERLSRVHARARSRPRAPLLRSAPSTWNARPAGFNGEPDLPYVLARRGIAMGYIFKAPLVAVPRTGKNKIPWYVRQPRDGSPLRITGHPAGADHPEVTRQFPADSSPGEIYPTGVEVPHLGCRVFTLTWDGHEDDVVSRFSSATRPHAS